MNSGVTLHHVEFTLGSPLGRFGVNLRSDGGHFGTLGGQRGVTLGTLRLPGCHFGATCENTFFV